MIEQSKGNLLEADAKALVNAVNTVGVMGKGIALQFRHAFPENYESYRKACKQGDVHLGKMFVTRTGQQTNPHFIINFPTKQDWRNKSRLSDVEGGLCDLVKVIRDEGITSVAIPGLGCGLGGLNWSDVHPLIEKAFSSLPDVHVFLYSP